MEYPKLEIPHVFIGDTPIEFANPTDGIRIASGVEQDSVDISPAMFQMDVSIDIPNVSDDVMRTLWEDMRMMDVVVKDDSGRELHIPNARVTSRVRLTGRIPRAMKKLLKKSYGTEWKHYHPNAVHDCEISNRD